MLNVVDWSNTLQHLIHLHFLIFAAHVQKAIIVLLIRQQANLPNLSRALAMLWKCSWTLVPGKEKYQELFGGNKPIRIVQLEETSLQEYKTNRVY